jgi:hypothetical protein
VPHDLIDRTAVLTRIHGYAFDDKLSGDEMAIFLRLAREVAAMPVVQVQEEPTKLEAVQHG